MNTGKKSLLTRLACLFFSGLFLLLWLGKDSLAQTREEYSVKAAFIFNFVKFSTWTGAAPTATDGTYDLYVVGDKSLESAFLTIDGKKIDSHLVRVHFKRTTDNFDNCDILFISRDIKRTGLLRVLTAVKGRPVLTIGEIPDFTQLGGVINLINKEGGGTGFEINRNTSRQQMVEISSRILRLAVLVDNNEAQIK